MVGEIVARVGMGEDGEPAAIEHSPIGEIPKLLRRYGKLAAAPWMRADGPLVEMADGHAEQMASLGGEGLGGGELVRIKVDVSVEISDHLDFKWALPCRSASGHKKGRPRRGRDHPEVGFTELG